MDSQENGTSANYPNFFKQDVDTAGNAVANSYDVLDTRWGVVISGQQSTETNAQWGGGSNPTVSDATQGGDILVGSGPNTAIGTVMPGDSTGSAHVSLYVRGTAIDGATQSGNYSTTVTLIVSADEKLSGGSGSVPNEPPPRFVDNGDGTITDNQTGLVGLKNGNCFGALNWSSAISAAANVASGQCGLTDGSLVGDWRLLTKDELLTYVAWKDSGMFVGANIATNNYWSSTTRTDYPSKAFYLVIS